MKSSHPRCWPEHSHIRKNLDSAIWLMEIADKPSYQINRLSKLQEHYMLRRAIDRGVSRERLAWAFNVNLSSINRRVNLLEGICPEVINLLQEKQVTPDVTGITRNMRAARQV